MKLDFTREELESIRASHMNARAGCLVRLDKALGDVALWQQRLSAFDGEVAAIDRALAKGNKKK